MTRPPRPSVVSFDATIAQLGVIMGFGLSPHGRLVWVPDSKRITLRDKAKAQAYDRRWQKDKRKTKVAPRA